VWYGVNQYGLRSYRWPYEKVGELHPEWLPLIEQFEACEQRFADRNGKDVKEALEKESRDEKEVL